MENPYVNVLCVLALVIVVVGGAIFIAEHVSCFNFFGLAKGCVVSH